MPSPGDMDYDPCVSGVPVALMTDTGALGDSIDDLKASIDLLTTAVNALIEAMAP